MSKDGRVTLVKSTPSSLPIYLMSILSMPTGVANKIEKQRTDFLGVVYVTPRTQTGQKH